MNEYRVTIDTISECYVYVIMADSAELAEIEAMDSARDDGWDGGGLPKITVETL